ncbi:MAG: NAD(P)H-dependent oxidoreductase subunit E [Anaerolineales bacterium]
MKGKISSIIKKYDQDGGRLLDMLLDIQGEFSCIPEEAVGVLAEELEMSEVNIEETVSFYHFFTREPAGKYAVYLNNSPVSFMYGRAEVAETFEKEVGVSFNEVTEDGLIGLWETADIGMNDQEPAAIINDTLFTELTPAKVKKIVRAMKEGKEIEEIAEDVAEAMYNRDGLQTMVKNNLHAKGTVLFSEVELGKALKKAVELTPEEIVEEIKDSNLRGRGGAGFPTGLKWDFCRRSQGERVYLICNADEGEPGTFKDRVIMTQLPEQLFESMAIAAYALEAQEGFVYLRYEYSYMKDYLEGVLQKMRDDNLLGKNILGKEGFDFDIRIQLGAGSYVCGAESALIESLEGKRGEPRNRPPFPVQRGYQDYPTVVNNVETLAKVAPIMIRGADWFKSIGTKESAGTKLLSISGDCQEPGVYEMEWGMTIREMLEMVGAPDTQAVIVGGPSGVCIDPTHFGRSVAFEDLATGGSMILVGEQRDLLEEFILPFTNFFIEESCGSCTPCRDLTVILRDKLLKILNGNGSQKDIDELYEWGQMGKDANRCGLGQTSANPILTTIENFRNLYEERVQTDEDYVSTFDFEKAVADSCEAVGRVPNIPSH